MATQTCDRTITGRNFNYNEALTIIQEEDYLEEEDIDDIRLIRKQGEVIQAIEKFEQKIEDNELLQRDKRHAPYGNAVDKIKEKISDTEELIGLDYESELLKTFDVPLHREKRFLFFNNSIDFCTNCTNNPSVPGIIATVLTVCGGLLLANPPPGNVPGNSPQPGTTGGGAVPTGTEGILALVPAGLVAVAVFPPFLTGRRFDAEAVIFKEAPGTLAGNPVERKKRSFGYCPQPSFLDRLFKNVRCLGPRLTQKFGRKPAPVNDYGYHGKIKRDAGYGFDDGCGECGTVEDCFDLPCPRYGFKVRYTFNRGGQNLGGYYGHGFAERQTGEGFRSAAEPDCRTTAG